LQENGTPSCPKIKKKKNRKKRGAETSGLFLRVGEGKGESRDAGQRAGGADQEPFEGFNKRGGGKEKGLWEPRRGRKEANAKLDVVQKKSDVVGRKKR